MSHDGAIDCASSFSAGKKWDASNEVLQPGPGVGQGYPSLELARSWAPPSGRSPSNSARRARASRRETKVLALRRSHRPRLDCHPPPLRPVPAAQERAVAEPALEAQAWEPGERALCGRVGRAAGCCAGAGGEV